MKTIKIVARQKIINPNTMQIHDDAGLKALDGYYEEILEVSDQVDIVKIAQNFEKNHPELSGWNIQIEEI